MKKFFYNKWVFQLALLFFFVGLIYAMLPKGESAAHREVEGAIAKIKLYEAKKGKYPNSARDAGITSNSVHYYNHGRSFTVSATYGIMESSIVRYSSDADSIETRFSY
ncbi:MAG: hypothetical protein EOP04_18980 [Proteobacteria bacterium]|nr:MAG: hypothetical protein EOP04_18980 [Pseudomonadota bacterium]